MNKKKRKKIRDTRSVAVKSETISVEELPLPVVYYPSHYGAFIAFKSTIDSPIYTFCECCRPALYNYVELLKASPNEELAGCMYTRKLVDIREFPVSFILQDNSKTLDDFYHNLHFAPSICHICNNKIPKYLYCIPMYGSKFKQNFGWYEKQDEYKIGVYKSPYRSCSRYIDKNGSIIFVDDIVDLSSLPPIMDTARLRLNVPEFRQKWKNELKLYDFVCNTFPDLTVLHHYRATWLDSLELDIFIMEYRIGIEYQGIQHYQPVSHWGGQEGFTKRRLNDIKKKYLCEKNGVQLVYFTYQEKIIPELIMEKLLPHLGGKPQCHPINTP